jgi:hypothetical protein
MDSNDHFDLETEAIQYTAWGGEWLAAARTYMQSHYHNGDTVTWGSHAEMKPPATVFKLEEMAKVVAEAVYKDLSRKWKQNGG